MNFFQALLTTKEIVPPPPPLFDTMAFFATIPQTSYGSVATRQIALEPSVAGADRAFSVCIWIAPHNVNDGLVVQRIVGVGRTTTNLQQWGLYVEPQAQTSPNQTLGFIIFGPSAANFIRITSTDRFLRARWNHVSITYDGSEIETGLKMYINAVEDTTAVKFMSGTYAGAGDDSLFRLMLGNVFEATRRYTGRMTFLDLWDKVLSAAEVTERFADGVPTNANGMSFVANLIARWNLEIDTNCQSNATFNIAATNINSSQQEISTEYQYLSIFNAVPGNTRYVAFGSIVKIASNQWFSYQRSGTDHLVSGKIVKMVFTRNEPQYTISSPVDVIIDATYDLRNSAAGVIGGNIVIFSTQSSVSATVFHDTKYYTSTDGLTGETFDAGVTVNSLFPAHGDFALTFGKIIEGPLSGEHMVSCYGKDGTTYWVGYLKRSVGGVWSFVSIYSGTTDYTETCLLNCGDGNFIALIRENSGGLFLSLSTDDGATWSVPAATGLASGVAMADLTLSITGKIVLIFADRGTSQVAVSFNNEFADLLVDPTDWVAISNVFHGYTSDGLGILGYPIILTDGYNGIISLSTEFSSSRGDLFMGYGQIQY